MNKTSLFVAAMVIAAGSQLAFAGKKTTDAAVASTWDCTAQSFDATQTTTIKSSYEAGMDAATIANMMGGDVTADNVQACIDANI